MPSVEIVNSSWDEMSARVNYTVSQDIAGNYSTVTVTGLELRSNRYYGSCFAKGSIYLDGQEVCYLGLSSTEGHTVALSVGAWAPVNQVSGIPLRITHGSDGAKTVSVSVSLRATPTSGSGSFAATCSGAASLVLPTIPRVSAITAAGVTLGTAMEIALTRAAEGFRDTVSWQCGDASGVVAEKTGETALTWTPPVSLAEANTQGAAVDVVLTVTTYSGETAIGSKSVTVSCPIPDSVVPSLEITVTDKTGCLEKYGSFVRTRSQARVQTAASGAYGSTVKSIAVSCGSLTASGEDAVFTLPDPGAVTVRVTVTDSRGRSATEEERISVADYQNPSVAVTALYRCDSDGTANPQGAYGKAVFTGAVTPLANKNSAIYRLKKRVRGTESWTVSQITGYTGVYAPQGEAIFSAGVDDDWEVCVSASDDFTEITGQVSVLPVAFSLLDFHRGSKSVGILQRAATPGAVDIGGDTVHHGHRIRDVGAPEEPGDGVTLEYLQNSIASEKGAPNGLATLNSAGKIHPEQAYTPTFGISGSRSLSLDDGGRFLWLGNDTGMDINITVPTNDAVPFPLGAEIEIARATSGQVGFYAAAGVAILSAGGRTDVRYIKDVYGVAYLKKVATDTWLLYGWLA